MRGAKKTERNAAVIRLAREGLLTGEDIGREFGISRQRVEQILRAAGVKARRQVLQEHQKPVDMVRKHKAPPKPTGPTMTPAGVLVTVCPPFRGRYEPDAAEPFFAKGQRLAPTWSGYAG